MKASELIHNIMDLMPRYGDMETGIAQVSVIYDYSSEHFCLLLEEDAPHVTPID